MQSESFSKLYKYFHNKYLTNKEKCIIILLTAKNTDFLSKKREKGIKK